MKLKIIIFLAFFSTFMDAKEVAGFKFPEKVKYDKTELVLNGCGTRTKMFVSVYCSGLYLIKKNSNAEKVTTSNKPMAVKMNFIYSHVAKSKVKSVWNDCFENVTDGNTSPIKKEIDQFLNYFAKEDIKAGDLFDLVYMPETGVQIYKKGKLLGTVKGMPFKKALFSVWFGDKPIQSNLKSGMLGK